MAGKSHKALVTIGPLFALNASMNNSGQPTSLDILVVDDTAANLNLLTTILEEAGYGVRAAPLPELALQSALAHPPGLILLDVRMPGMDGFEVCQRLKQDKRTAEVPVIFISALQELSVRVQGFKAGGVDFIIKPFQREEVLARVSAQLELKTLRDDLNRKVEERTHELAKANVALKSEITERVKAVKEVKHSREQLRSLVVHMHTVREEEQKRIARDIHDDLGQLLTAININISSIEDMAAEDQKDLLAKAQETSALVSTTISKVQQVAAGLRPMLLDDLGIIAAIEWQINGLQNRTGIHCSFDSNFNEVAMNEKFATEVFRISQEALTNVARHAEATEVETSLNKYETEIILKVRDNGKGVTEDEINDSRAFGFIGIRERAHSLNGSVKISGKPGEGTCIIVTFPIGDDK